MPALARAPQPTRFANFILSGIEDGRTYYAWLCITLGFALLPYLFFLPSILHDPYVVQDDARHFVVWLRRFVDPGLYSQDMIADYFAALTPWLYGALFWPAASLGIDPVLVHLYLIMPITGLALAAATYAFTYHFWPSPMGAAVTAVVMSSLLGITLGMAQGLPRDFGFTIVLLLMLGFLSRRIFLTGALMCVGTGLLPVAALTSGAAMAFLMLSRRFPFVTREFRAWLTFIAAGMAAAGGGLFFLSASQQAGETLTSAEARSLAFFGMEGQRPYFGRSFASSYLCNERAGIVPLCESGADWQMFAWTVVVISVLCLAFWAVGSGRAGTWLRHVGLPALDRRLASTWAALVASGLVLFPVAHAVAFELHLPQRFAHYTITLTFGIVAAMAVSASFLAVVKTWLTPRHKPRVFEWAPLLAATLVLVWLAASIGNGMPPVRTDAPDIHAYLRTTERQTLVAGVVEEIDSIPAFSWRSVLVSMQLLVPYKKPYYEEMARRMTELARSLYAPEPTAFAEFRTRYGIDYIVVERTPRDGLDALRGVAANFSSVQDVVQWLESGREPFFRARLEKCERAGSSRLVLVDAACIVETPER